MNGVIKNQGIRISLPAIQQVPGCPFAFNGEGVLPGTGSNLINMSLTIERYIVIAISCSHFSCQYAAIIK
ncbi:Uncharacterised protein [Escherichia coli]|nr:Uncharacterised protein [Escherichia coli]